MLTETSCGNLLTKAVLRKTIRQLPSRVVIIFKLEVCSPKVYFLIALFCWKVHLASFYLVLAFFFPTKGTFWRCSQVCRRMAALGGVVILLLAEGTDMWHE